jgi:KDO2-lipid IV(A) lauroyltransferase
MDLIEYIFVRFLYAIFRLLPMSFSRWMAEGLAIISGRVIRYRRGVIVDNLKNAFPEKSGEEIDRLIPGIYRHFMYLWVEVLQTWRLNSPRYMRNFVDEGTEKIKRIIETGKPVILVGGHLGNFEWLGWYMAQFVPSLHAIMKPVHNPYLNNFIIKNRLRMGVKLIFTGEKAFTEGMNALRENGSLAIVADQDAGERGIYVNFLNRPASTATGAALYHKRTGTSVFYCSFRRTGFGKFVINAEEVVAPGNGVAKNSDIFSVTQKYTELLEKDVRKYPEQYFWTHRRWKNQPAGEDLKIYSESLAKYKKLQT